MRTASSRFFAPGLALAAVALLLAMPAGLRADGDTPTQETPTLSDTVGDGLAKLKPFLDDKNWPAASKLVGDLLAGAAADSYDQAFLLETKAKILTMSNNYADAIEPLATSLDISDRHHFYSRQQTLDMLYFLSQLYYEQAEGTKADHDTQIAFFVKAISTIQRWLALAPKATADISEYYSRLLYAEAVAKDAAHPDAALIKQARQQVEKTLLLTSRPKESTYVFLLATLQQEQDYVRAAEILEFLLAKNPKNKTYWGDLVTFYTVLAQAEKDPVKVRRYNVRAINTIERAQGFGYLKTPRDNYLLFTFYYETGQYGTASQLLHDGLANGSIDSDLDKWGLLASSYQQINQDFTAIEVLKEATERFPKNGDLDLKIAGLYAGLDKGEESLKYYELAKQKGVTGKSQRAYLLLALGYQAYELQKYDEAKESIDQAILEAKGKDDHQLKVLKSAIDDAIKARDAKKPGDAPDTSRQQL